MRIQFPTLRKQALLFLNFIIFCFISCSKGSDENPQNQPPQNFTVSVSNATSSTANLNWTASKDPESQSVVYSVELNSESLASALASTNFNLTNLAKNTNYAGKVIASDPAGNKTSSSFSFTTSDTPSPSDFILTVDSTSNKAVFLSWTAATLPDNGPVTYDVFVNGTLKSGNINQTKFTISGLSPQTDYQLKVMAKTQDGKSREKITTGKTKENHAPLAFTIQEVKHGFSYMSLSCTGTSDPDNDQVSYFLVINNVEKSLSDLNNITTAFNYAVKNLNADESYSLYLKAKDEFGTTVSSNTLTGSTHKAPVNPVITIKEENNKIVVEWISNTLDQFNQSASNYFVNGEQKGMGDLTINYHTQTDNTVLVKLFIDPADYGTNVSKSIKITLNWGENNNNATTTSNIISYAYYNYAPTSAEVSAALIKGPGQFPPQFSLNFKNCVISEYSSWDITEFKFDNVSIDNFAGFAICDPSKIGYYTGNVTDAQYTYLKTKNSGHIIVKDNGGYHKLNFTYTTQD